MNSRAKPLFLVLSLSPFLSLAAACGPPAEPCSPECQAHHAAEAAQMPKCGDGVLATGEACDDGNLVAGDGCDACKLEPPRCSPDAPGKVLFARCAGQPSKCAREVCSVNGDGPACPPEVGEREVNVGVARLGELAPDDPGAISVRSSPAGVDCRCTDDLDGRCEGCIAKAPACLPIQLTADVTDARWNGACAGAGATCVLAPDVTPAAVQVHVAPAWPRIRSVIALPEGIYPGRELAVTADGRVAVTGMFSHRIAIGKAAFWSFATQDGLVVVLSPSGAVESAYALGDVDRVRALAIAFGPGGDQWLVTSEGDHERRSGGDALEPDDEEFPRFVVRRVRAGADVWKRRLDVPAGYAARLAVDGAGEAVVALQSVPRGGGDAALAVAALRPDGAVRWSWSGASEAWAEIRDLAVDRGRVRLRAITRHGAPAGDLLGPAEDNAGNRVLEIALDDRGRASAARTILAVPEKNSQEVAFDAAGRLTTIDVVHTPSAELLLRGWATGAAPAWKRQRKPNSTCAPSDAAKLLAVHRETGVLAFAEHHCGVQGVSPALHAESFRFLAEGGRDLGGVRLGQPGGSLSLHAMTFTPGGTLVALVNAAGHLELGDVALEGANRPVLLFIDPPGRRLAPVAR